MITEKQLIEKGYKRHPKNDLWRYSEFFYQKEIYDILGEKYFIDMVYYAAIVEIDFCGAWMCALRIEKPFYSFDQHGATDLDKCEANCEKFFQTFKCEDYEKWTR